MSRKPWSRRGGRHRVSQKPLVTESIRPTVIHPLFFMLKLDLITTALTSRTSILMYTNARNNRKLDQQVGTTLAPRTNRTTVTNTLAQSIKVCPPKKSGIHSPVKQALHLPALFISSGIWSSWHISVGQLSSLQLSENQSIKGCFFVLGMPSKFGHLGAQ